MHGYMTFIKIHHLIFVGQVWFFRIDSKGVESPGCVQTRVRELYVNNVVNSACCHIGKKDGDIIRLPTAKQLIKRVTAPDSVLNHSVPCAFNEIKTHGSYFRSYSGHGRSAVTIGFRSVGTVSNVQSNPCLLRIVFVGSMRYNVLKSDIIRIIQIQSGVRAVFCLEHKVKGVDIR